MTNRRTSSLIILLVACSLMIAVLGCSAGGSTGSGPTPTPVPPTVTPLPPTVTPAPPTATPSVISQGQHTLTSHCGLGEYAMFDLDAGSASSSTPDIIFGDSCISPGGAYQVRQGSSTIKLAAISSSAQSQAQFDAITAAQLHVLSYTSFEIGVLNGWTFAVHTHGGHYAKVWEQSQVVNFSTSPDVETYTIQWVTYP